MGLKELRSFVTILDHGGISQAAETLHLSPPAVHKQIRCLEAELGVRLYERVGRRLKLTEAGEIFLPHVRDLLADYRSGLDALNEWKGLGKGLIRIGSGPATSAYFLPPLLKEFRRRFPQVELSVETGNSIVLLESLSKGALDFAFVVSSGLPEDSRFSVEIEWPFEIVPVASPEQAPRSRSSIQQLAKCPFILFKAGSRMESAIDRYFTLLGFHPRVVMRLDNPEAIKTMMQLGLGISMLPAWTIQREVAAGSLRLIRQRERPLVGKMRLVTRKSHRGSRSVESFLELARTLKWRRSPPARR